MSAEAAVQELCATMGVGARELPLVLRFERSGELHIERSNDGILIYLAREVPGYRHGVAAAALRAVHPDRADADGADPARGGVRVPLQGR